MAVLLEGILDKFQRITRYPIKRFLSEYTDFIDNDKTNVYDYYAGKLKKPITKSFNKLESLLEESQIIENMIENKRDSLKNGAFWDVIELLSDIQIQLQTIDNASKWLRSAIGKNDFRDGVEFSHTLQQLQTLEQVASDVTGSSTREQDWVTIALRNDLREEDYNPAGGNDLALMGRNNATIKLKSVVDNIKGERVYGKDLDRKLQFTDNDLKSLTHKETVKQSVDILVNLRRGTTPEFPSDGISIGAGVGSNRANIAFPILVRQMSATFRRDDTLQTLRVKDIGFKQDALFITLEVSTRLGDALQVETQLL